MVSRQETRRLFLAGYISTKEEIKIYSLGYFQKTAKSGDTAVKPTINKSQSTCTELPTTFSLTEVSKQLRIPGCLEKALGTKKRTPNKQIGSRNLQETEAAARR